jgi:hypothetical protein
MNPSTLSGNRTLRIALIGVGISLIAGFAAIFVFKVDSGTVLTIGLFGLFMASHLFMHGGHGGHEGHSQHTQPADQTTRAASKADGKNKQTERSGCH